MARDGRIGTFSPLSLKQIHHIVRKPTEGFALQAQSLRGRCRSMAHSFSTAYCQFGFLEGILTVLACKEVRDAHRLVVGRGAGVRVHELRRLRGRRRFVPDPWLWGGH